MRVFRSNGGISNEHWEVTSRGVVATRSDSCRCSEVSRVGSSDEECRNDDNVVFRSE